MNTLRALRENKNILQRDVAEAIGVDRTTYTKYENGKCEPSHDILKAISKFFNVSIDYLLNEGIENGGRERGVRIPVIGVSAAGIPIETLQQYIDENDSDTWEEITESMAATGEFVAVTIKGDSMAPRILEGDIVIVKVQPTAENGETAIVIVNGDEATCKKIKKSHDGLMLISNNTNYEPIFYTKKEIDNLPVRIFGKVVEVRGKL